MANNYSDATGVLILQQVTPVITALFSGFNLDATYPGNGQAYVADVSEDTDHSWDTICENLAALSESLGLALPDDGEGESQGDDNEQTAEDYLYLLATHFGADHNDEFGNLIERVDFEADADLPTLLEIAMALDDGHGLTALDIQGSWSCSKPRLFEFGGYGSYCSKYVTVHGTAYQPRELGEHVHAALVSNDPCQAARRILQDVDRILNGISNADVRAEVRKELNGMLAVADNAAPAAHKWFAVTGRIPGDDEDAMRVFHVATREEAIAAFEVSMYEDETAEARDNVMAGHGQAVFINSIAWSDSPIQAD